MIKIGDLLGTGLILISIWVFFEALKTESSLLKFIGIIGAVIVLVVEGFFLYEKWRIK